MVWILILTFHTGHLYAAITPLKLGPFSTVAECQTAEAEANRKLVVDHSHCLKVPRGVQ